jgi:putative oxidoreductase
MTMRKLIYPGSPTFMVSVALLVLRFTAGLAFMDHGSGKILNPFQWMGPDATMPGFLQALAAISEFGGGAAWMLGLLTPLASFGLFCTMGVAVKFHFMRGDPFVSMAPPSFELAAIYLCVALLLLTTGAGKFSWDHHLFADKES